MIVGDVVMTAEDVAEVVVVEVVEVHTKHTIKGTEVITTKTRPMTGQGKWFIWFVEHLSLKRNKETQPTIREFVVILDYEPCYVFNGNN